METDQPLDHHPQRLSQRLSQRRATVLGDRHSLLWQPDGQAPAPLTDIAQLPALALADGVHQVLFLPGTDWTVQDLVHLRAATAALNGWPPEPG